MATIVAMMTVPLGDARDRFSALVTSVEQTHDRVTVTRNGVPAAVIVTPPILTLRPLSAACRRPQRQHQHADRRRGSGSAGPD
jgi:prevent-host-death family protein